MEKKKVSFKDLLGLATPAPLEIRKKIGEATKAQIIAEASDRYVPDKMLLNFEEIAKSTDFQRFVVFLMKHAMPGVFSGVSTRTSTQKMVSQIDQKRKDYTLVMGELKKVLKLRREKLEESKNEQL